MSADHPPNFLICMTDQQRADALSLAPDGFTPHLARFANEALRFPQTFCPSPHCCPSRATFFTGLYPSRHGVWNNVLNGQALGTGPRAGVRLWSEHLAERGYELHFSGKWHVCAERSPAAFGWSEHFVSAHGGRDHHGPRWADYKSGQAANAGRGPRAAGRIEREGYRDIALFETLANHSRMPHDPEAVDGALEGLAAATRSGKPWVVYNGLFGPHDPYAITSEWLDRVPPGFADLPGSFADDLSDKPTIYRRLRRQVWDQFSRDEAREARRHYLAYCAYVDHQFGRLLAALERSGQAENTIVIFLSDHGDYAGEHGLFCKGIPAFQGAYRVPNYVRWPGGVARPGEACEAFVSLADFGPTMLEMAGVPFDPDELSGRSLVPWLRGRDPEVWREEMFTQCNGVELGYSQRAVFTRDWKYVFNGFDEDELYDLSVDPGECVNLAGDPNRRDVIREMCGRLWRQAHREQDQMINDYYTVALAPYGPGEAFAD